MYRTFLSHTWNILVKKSFSCWKQNCLYKCRKVTFVMLWNSMNRLISNLECMDRNCVFCALWLLISQCSMLCCLVAAACWVLSVLIRMSHQPGYLTRKGGKTWESGLEKHVLVVWVTLYLKGAKIMEYYTITYVLINHKLSVSYRLNSCLFIANELWCILYLR